ncbi:hypothetical protein ACFS7Z_15815 [Pontibacter toksunensis]|uniref:Uncharacterized protein n=1 Tax=Pontibacter toksunensis TaxID=1332631 RepID=A0ABW6BXW2_9BACT
MYGSSAGNYGGYGSMGGGTYGAGPSGSGGGSSHNSDRRITGNYEYRLPENKSACHNCGRLICFQEVCIHLCR